MSETTNLTPVNPNALEIHTILPYLPWHHPLILKPLYFPECFEFLFLSPDKCKLLLCDVDVILFSML
ncbi:MAG: hypothetical protein SH817_06835 [Leptospira sp.]|nr:hypothetical protein [Leptospira sp.]